MTALEMDDLKKLRLKYTKMLNQVTLEESDNASKTKFFEELISNIKQGKLRVDDVKVQLKLLKSRGMQHLLGTYPNDVLGPLQLAAFFYKSDNEMYLKIIRKFVKLCPELIWRQRTGQFEGQNVLHIAIVNRNIEAASTLLKQEAMQARGHRRSLLQCKATGPGFKDTVMMGQLPLATAALTFNWPMVELLIENGAKLHSQNSLGDTVFHTLVRYAARYPDKLQDAQDMMIKLHREIERRWEDEMVEVRDLWLIENNERLTALRLAAACAQPELFKLIHNLHGVYRNLDFSDGLFDSQFYDVTELDPVALRRWADLSTSSNKEQLRESQKEAGLTMQTLEKSPTRDHIRDLVNMQAERKPRLVSVLEAICETKPGKESLGLLDTDIVREMIGRKWKNYRPMFWFWFVLHSVIMILLSVNAVFKAKVVSSLLQGEQPSVAEKTFAITVSAFALFAPLVVVTLELLMRFRRKQQLKLKLLHHNGTYRVVLVFFSLCVAADAIWFLAAASLYQIYIQVLVLLSGWWFMTFFLRPCKKFSFLTVMLQRILFGDMIRFSFIIALMLVAFTLAMHTTYLITSHGDMPPAFSSPQVSFLTMFQLLLGLADSGEVLQDSPNKWLANILYVTFLLLTYVLMLNALIAMMSKTCTTVSESRVRQYELQRLSVVLMLESLLPFDFMAQQCGQGERVARFDFRRQRPFEETRFFLKVLSAQSNSSSRPKQQPGDSEENIGLENEEENAHSAMRTAFAKQKSRLGQTMNSVGLARLRSVFRLDSTDSQQSGGTSTVKSGFGKTNGCYASPTPALKLRSVSIPDVAELQASGTRVGKMGRQTPIQPEIVHIHLTNNDLAVGNDPRGQLHE